MSDNITASLGLSPESDFPNQPLSSNYTYDEIGQLNRNYADNQIYAYNSSGLVTSGLITSPYYDIHCYSCS